MDGGVGVDVIAGLHRRGLSNGVEFVAAQANRSLAGLPCLLGDILQGEVEAVLPAVLTVGSIGSNHVLPLGCIG